MKEVLSPQGQVRSTMVKFLKRQIMASQVDKLDAFQHSLSPAMKHLLRFFLGSNQEP